MKFKNIKTIQTLLFYWARNMNSKTNGEKEKREGMVLCIDTLWKMEMR